MSRITIRLLLVWGVVTLLVLRELLGMPGELQRTEESARVQLATVVQSAAQLFDTTLMAVDQVIQATVEALPAVGYVPGNSPPLALQAFLARHQRMAPGIDALAIFDAEGKLVSSSITLAAPAGIADRAYFRGLKAASNQGRPQSAILSQALISRLTGKPSLQVARRIENHDGRFAGVVVASIDIEKHFGQKLSRLPVSESLRFGLLDDDQRLLLVLPFNSELTGKYIPKLAVFSEDKQYPLYELNGIDGHRRLTIKLLLSSFPVAVGVSERMDLVMAPWKDSRNKSILILLVVLTGGVLLSLAIWRDHQNQARMRLSQEVFSHVKEGILITDTTGVILDANPRMAELTGYTHDEMLGQRPSLFRSGRHNAAFYRSLWESLQHKDLWRGEIWNRHKAGELYAMQTSITAVRDGNGRLTQYVAMSTDITEQKLHHEVLEAKLNHDALTGLPNRALLQDRLQTALNQARREHRQLAVCFIDLDDFKPINDKLGHHIGDQVLIEVADRLRAGIRGGDTAARLGGDEFVLILTRLTGAEECRQGIERLLNAITEPMITEGGPVQVSASIGMALYPRDAQNGDELLLIADQAMYEAKRAGRNRYSEHIS
jgi:diguanylate cyclase (GGDEF)-like protein/PAS domain S-box-containing protein